MTAQCRIDNDPFAGMVCQLISDYVPEALDDLDQGLETTSFVRDGSSWRAVRTQEGPDAFVSGPEIYQRILQRVPSLLDPSENDANRLNRLIAPQADRIRTVLAHRRIARGTLNYQVQFHRLLMAYVTSSPSQGGLGVRFDSAVNPPRTPGQVLTDRLAACLDFVTFYRQASEIAGEPLTPLELFQSGSAAQMHVAMGIKDPATGNLSYVVDLMDRQPVARPRPSDVWSEISRRELLAYFYNARAARNPDPAQAEADVDFALRLNPGNYLLLFNKAFYEMDRGRLQEARDHLQQSIAANPTYSPAYVNLNQVALRLRDQTLADRAWDGYSRSVSPTL